MKDGTEAARRPPGNGLLRWFTWLAIEHKILLSIVFALGWYFSITGSQGADFLSRKPALIFVVLLMAAPSVFIVVSTFLHVLFTRIGVKPLVIIEIPLYAGLSVATYYFYLSLWISLILHGDAAHAFATFRRWMAVVFNMEIPNVSDTISLGTPNGQHLVFGPALEWVLAIALGITIVEAIADCFKPSRRYAA